MPQAVPVFPLGLQPIAKGVAAGAAALEEDLMGALANRFLMREAPLERRSGWPLLRGFIGNSPRASWCPSRAGSGGDLGRLHVIPRDQWADEGGKARHQLC